MGTFLFLRHLCFLIAFFQVFRLGAENLLLSREISFLKGLFLFRLHYNRGISFALFSSSPEFLPLILACFFLVAALFLFAQRKNFGSRKRFFWGALLLGAGSLSNLGERFAFGAVTDYAGFPFPLFGYLFVNLADLALLSGTAVLLLSFKKPL